MTWNEETRILKADEGKWVTEDDINFAIEVKLAPSEDVDNWREVDELPPQPIEEKIDYLADESEEEDDVPRGTSEIDGGADND